MSAWTVIGDGSKHIAYERARLAMAVRSDRNMHYRLRDIQPRHWRRLADRCGPGAWERMTAMVASVDGMLKGVEAALPAGFPERTWRPIAAGMRRHAQLFQRLLAAAP